MSYPGGKGGSGVVQQIINQIPPHRVYVEPFVGGGAVLRAKLPAVESIVVDVDHMALAPWFRPGVTAICGDAISFLESYEWQGGEYVYCDPPYLMETRSSKRPLYRHEFGGEDDHRRLLAVVKRLPCMVSISGYWSELYDSELSGWRSISYQTVTRGGRKVTEYLWMNYGVPRELHDYRYLGNDYKERWNLAKQRRRWRARLERMSLLERYALVSSIAEFGGAGSPVDLAPPVTAVGSRE
jgi:site-specific DNA-adenine methylase